MLINQQYFSDSGLQKFLIMTALAVAYTRSLLTIALISAYSCLCTILCPQCHQAVGASLLLGWLQMWEVKLSWEKGLYMEQGSSSALAFLMQAGSACLQACDYVPPGSQWRLKKLEFGMRSHAVRCCSTRKTILIQIEMSPVLWWSMLMLGSQSFLWLYLCSLSKACFTNWCPLM